jgi:hypothetical protein
MTAKAQRLPSIRVMTWALSPPGAGVVRSRFGDSMFILFIWVQVADGWLTYLGIRTYGLAVEANPLIGWYIAVYGAAGALIGAKAAAVICGAILHLTARHQIIGLLTVGYLAAAIWPWVRILWP